MAEYIKDEADTLARLGELVEQVRFAEYELSAAVALLKITGASWAFIGEGMGLGGKQAASQWFKRNGDRFGLIDRDNQPTVQTLDEAEYEGASTERDRIARVLGLGRKVPRYQVRLIVAGRRGINKVHYKVVSTHLKRDAAEARARKLEGPAEVWMIEANGTETRVPIRRLREGGATTRSDEPW